ncbi:fungal-specific transcription factor domain-containing protein [Exophiala viscosa]|uniref:fungal-specific transcription factor domain-containing protein n=1 Tax=Exophiala viscosa TaxID=2486360 RepID=UPI0021963C4C|nr:fungal-specific transcription factor domain-containing protein [Exophiala viscosa]
MSLASGRTGDDEIEAVTSSQRATDKRASNACRQCRTRKVKCNVVETGQPCDNCRVDDVECIIPLSRRSRRYHLQKARQSYTQQPPQALVPGAEQASPTTGPGLIPTSERASSTAQVQEDHDHADFHHIPQVAGSQLREVGLPTFIKPPHRDFDQDELDFLRRRGALSIPEEPLRGQLILACLLYVYPLMPIMDVQEFLDAVEGRSDRRVSLIFFQAVMLAGVTFTDIEYLRDAGFEGRLAARAYFSKKVKLLYDFEWENDRVALIQALLLHQWWNPKTNDQKDPWHWLGICVSLATSLGLNDPNAYTSVPAKTCRLWRKLWWSCVTMDRLYCIAVRKPLRIREEDIVVPLLTFKDFDVQPFKTEIAALQNISMVTDCVEQVMQANMFMSQLRLLRIVGRIMERMYTLRRFSGETCDWAMFYVPRKDNDFDYQIYEELQKELDEWSNTLNDYCKLSYDGEDVSEMSQRPLIISRGVLKLFHLQAIETLHRPFSTLTLHLTAALTDAEGHAQKAKARIKEAVQEMLEIIHTFRQRGFLQLLHPISITCILTIVAYCAMEIRTALASGRDLLTTNNNHQDQYEECVGCLEALHDVWPITPASCAMARRMVSSDQTSFARNLRMLSTPVEGTTIPVDTVPNAGQNLQASQANSSNLRNPVLPVQPAMPLALSNNDSEYIDASLSSIYSAAVYPYYHVEPDLTFTENFTFLDPSSFLPCSESVDGFGRPLGP